MLSMFPSEFCGEVDREKTRVMPPLHNLPNF